nr:MAG TPA: hypothetical protein [Caudoviricetes sp.]
MQIRWLITPATTAIIKDRSISNVEHLPSVPV